jgi:hypothetical protein
MQFRQTHFIYFITLFLILFGISYYSSITPLENYQDFSKGLPRAPLDTLCYKSDDISGKTPPSFACLPNNRHPSDDCQQCDGLCINNGIGKVFPSPVTNPSNYPPITAPSGFYHIQSANKYLAYDLNSLDADGLQLYLTLPKSSKDMSIPDLSWKLEKEVGFYRIATCREPRLYLHAKDNGKLGMSYFQIGEWILAQKCPTEIIIRSRSPSYYLNSINDKTVQLGTIPQCWRLVKNAPCLASSASSTNNSLSLPITPLISSQIPLPMTPLKEGYENIFQFPDTVGSKSLPQFKNQGIMKEWNQYYSDFWNGEYIYKNTTPTNKDYLTITLHSDGQGIVTTKTDVWQILSVSPNLLYGENKSSLIYLEMLTAEKGGKYYDPNRPQVRIITKNKSTNKLESLVGNNPNNLNAYSTKIGTVGQNVTRYPAEKFTNQLPTAFFINNIVPLDSNIGYQLPKTNLNIPKPCVMSSPTQIPVFSGYWGRVDTTGILKKMGNLGPMEIQYSYLYKCADSPKPKESTMSPVLKMETSVGSLGAYYDAVIYIYSNVGVDSINVYVKGPGDIQFLLNQNVKNNNVNANNTKIEVLVSPRIVKDILTQQTLR